MPVILNVSSSARREVDFLGRLSAGFVPALQRAINDTAFDVRKVAIDSLSTDLDRPTPFTKRGILVERANRETLTASIHVLPKQAEYLIRQVTPATRQPFKEWILIPATGSRRNQYGNITKAARKKLFQDPKNRIVDQGNRVLIFRGRKLVATLVKQTRYRVRRWKFYERAEREALRKFPRNLNSRLGRLERSIK